MVRFRLQWRQLCSILLFILLPFIHGSADIQTQELLNLKSQITDHTNSLTSWHLPTPTTTTKSSQIQACSWSGITCTSDNTTITGLDLSNRRLSSPTLTPIKFHLFTDLTTLNLSSNAFSGTFPLTILNLTSLRTLDISRNNFSGPFPPGLPSLTHLTTLDAFSNSFSGPLPPDLSQITTLQTLNLAGSYFMGPIPPEFGDFASLTYIHLAGNDLTGPIPPQLGKLHTLTHMEIGYNSYVGATLPPELGNMSTLQYLDIAGAGLAGSIPTSFSNLTKLHTLYLFKNRLTGPIPSEFRNLVSLRSLDLSDNRIAGPFPDGFFSSIKELRLLSLFLNEMTGTVPAAISELPRLESLLIWKNNFTGPLPARLGRNSDLRFLDVSSNRFNGTVPPDLCANGKLSRLILFSNAFTGYIPPSVSECPSLVRLRLEDNSLSGEINLDFAALTQLSYIDLSANDFVGGIPDDIVVTSNSRLEYFNVSNNPRLSGSIPDGIWSSLPNLQNFSAASCGITNSIPDFNNNKPSSSSSSSSSCSKSLTLIELNSNSLTGTIPASISDCPSLTTVDFSNNHLTGSIPKNLSSMPTAAFNNNDDLCGAPLPPCSSSSDSKRQTNEFLWILILCITVVVFITLAVSALFYFQRSRQNKWKMVSFPGLPQFTPNDILKSFNSSSSSSSSTDSSCSKALLPTGITVSVKKLEWGMHDADTTTTPTTTVMLGYVTQMGNARHENLTRLLGYCYNKRVCYLLYEYFPPGKGNLGDRISSSVKMEWEVKYKIVLGVAKGLCFLHHDCRPAIPHGDLKASNVVFPDSGSASSSSSSSEPQLADFGYKFLLRLNNSNNRAGDSLIGSKLPWIPTDHEPNATLNYKEALREDIYSFGEMVVEILTNGRVSTDSGRTIHSKQWEALLEDVYRDNQRSNNKFEHKEEMKAVLQVALLCTRPRPSDRPTMDDALKLLKRRR